MPEKYRREKAVLPSVKATTTERILYSYGKCLGLCPFTVDDIEIIKFSNYGFVYGIMVTMAYTWIFVNAVKLRVKTDLPGETPMALLANCSADIFRFVCMCITWLMFACRQKRILTIVESFVRIGVTASKLGIVEYKRYRFFRNLAIHLLLVNVTFLGYSVTDYAQLFLQVDAANPIYFALFHGVDVVCRNLVILFVDTVLLVRDRFACLNEATRDLATARRGVRNERRFKFVQTGSNCIFPFGHYQDFY